MNRARLGLFLGAGASLARPSNLPTFKDILNSWIDKLADVTELLPDKERQSLLRQRIADTPPEVIFQSIDECKRRDLQKALSFTFNLETMPNTNHYIAAEVMRRGGVVWTTNFDVLVERASKIPPEDRSLIAFDHNDAVAFTNPNIKLLKPHGTIAVPESLIFRSKDVLRPLPDPVRQRLGQDVAGYFFVIIGYSASDVDIQPLLRQALETAGDALWFCRPSEEDRLRDRFRQASQKHNIQFNVSANPSCEFWKWARSEGLLSEVPDCLLSTPNVSALEVLLNDPIVLAKWFQRLRAFDVASHILKPKVFRHPRAAFSYLRLLRYQYHPLGTLSAFTWYLLEMMNPRTRDRALYSLSYLAFDSGRYSLGGRIAGLGLHNASSRRQIQLASCFRMLGSFDEALRILQGLGEQRLQRGDANEEARVVFELAITLRWSGKEEEALRAMSGLPSDRLLHADPSWEGWLEFEQGTCLSLRGKLHEASRAAQRAEEIFLPILFTQPLGLINTRLLQSTVARLSDDIHQARRRIEESRELLASTSSGRRPFAEEALAFEEGEIARQEHRYEDAETAYKILLSSRFPLHRGHGALGMAEIERAKGNLQRAALWATQALRGYQRLGCLWGVSNAILTLVLCNDLDWHEGESNASKTGYELPEGSLRGLLFGLPAERRALNLP